MSAVVEDGAGFRFTLKRGTRVRHWNTAERGEVIRVHRDGTFDVRFDGYAALSKNWTPNEFFAESNRIEEPRHD